MKSYIDKKDGYNIKDLASDKVRRNASKINKSFLLSILLLLVIGVSYAYLSTSLNITGEVTGNFINDGYVVDPSGNPDLKLSNPIINYWKEGNAHKYQYRLNISNKGNNNYDNFTIELTFNNNIKHVNIWNYNHEIKNKNLTIINTNYDLNSNKSLEISFIVETNFDNLKLIKVKLETSTIVEEVDPTKFEVVFNRTNTWGSYVHQYNVTVTNKTGKLITYWQVDLTLPDKTNYENGWNALFEEVNQKLIIKNQSYNGRIDNNKSTTFGLQLQTDISDLIPSNYKIMVR